MTLVHISIPPFHQSTNELMACPTCYVESVIKGNPQPGGMDSARGRQIHQTGAAYFSHCALHGVASDLEAFDQFTAGAGPVAARILAGMRDNFTVDYQHLLATELTLSLDEDLQPTNAPDIFAEVMSDSDKEPMVVGTLDALYSFADQNAMRIDDLKSHPRPFDPSEKLQGKTYALLVFQHFAWVEKVTFRLIFVRYRNVVREVEFIRAQVPELVATIRAARARQIKIHQDYEAGKDIEALAGNHCCYCPLLSNAQCPIAAFNPQSQYTPEERLNFHLWYGQFSRANNSALKAHVDASGRPVVLRDYNGKAYTYGPEEKESAAYPVFRFDADGMELRDGVNPTLPIIDLLYDYAHDNPGDSDWMRKLTLSGTTLKKYLKTNKRAFLDQAIEDTADKVTKVALRVSKPLDAVPEDIDEYDDEEEFEDNEL